MSIDRIRKIRNHKNFEDIEALLISKKENVIYSLGFKIESDTKILIPDNSTSKFQKVIVFLNALEYDQAKENIEKQNGLNEITEIIKLPPKGNEFISKKISELNLQKVGFEDNYITVKTFQEWKSIFKGIDFIPSSSIISDARVIKTDAEIKHMKKAANFGELGFQTIYNNIEEGMTEKELAAMAEYEMRKAGSNGPSFETIVASGKQSSFPHAITSEKKVEYGDIIIVDLGAIYNGYCSDMTRTFIFNRQDSKIDKKKAELVNIVNECQKFVLQNIKAGEKGRDIDKLSRKFFKEHKKEWASRYIHSLGHGVGIDIHEDPYLSPISDDVLKEGMCVTVEPGLYIPELGGARTEDLILINEEGFEYLTNMEKYYY